MNKLVLTLCATLVAGSCFASSVVGNVAESVAMADCLKNKTQLECNAMEKVGSKAVQSVKTSQTTN